MTLRAGRQATEGLETPGGPRRPSAPGWWRDTLAAMRRAAPAGAISTPGTDVLATGRAPAVGALLLSALVVLAAFQLLVASPPAAEAVQPYAPRGIVAQPVPSADWFALTVRASGFRPNSTALVEVEGLGQQSMIVDAAGVVDIRVELPDRVAVEVRGIGLEGGGLQLRQEVPLVRPDDRVRNVLVFVLSGALVSAAVLAPRIRERLGRRGAPVDHAAGAAGP